MSDIDPSPWVPKHNPWLIAITVSLATFMEVLDTSVANVALPHIAGSFGASQDESTWVLTSYLVSNAVILPLAAYLSTLMGRKRFYMMCVALFGISSLLCGLSAAVYGASEGLHTVLIERFSIGGQAGSTSRIENYLGFPEGISGAELASRARDQALRLGAEIVLAAECIGGKLDGSSFLGMLDSGATVKSRSIICATGVEYIRLNLANEERLLGRGFYYGAGSSEASLCRGHVFVVGGGNSAGQAALHLASRASKVTMLVRGPSLKSTLSQYLVDRIGVSSNIGVKVNSVLAAIEGGESLEKVRYRALETDEETEVDTGWVFACVGGKPQTEWTDAEQFARDAAGYILTGTDLLQEHDSPLHWPLERAPYPMEASAPGMFVAGDLRANSIKRCATAVGEGAAAVASVHRYLSSMN